MCVVFAQAALERYLRDGTGLFRIRSLAEQSQFAVLLRANNSGSAGRSGVRSGEEKVSDAVVMKKADEADCDLDGVMTAAETNGSGPKRKLCELQTECWTAHIEVPAGFVDVVQMAKRSSTIEEQQRESGRELLKTQSELHVARGAFLKAQHLALSKSKVSRSCHQELRGVEEQLALVREKATSVEVAIVKDAA